LIESGPDILSHPLEVADFLRSLSAWLGDPAVLTAIASLLTALAAFFRTRHRRAEPLPPLSAAVQDRPPSRAYETLHIVEEKIREVLLRQLQNLQEEAELLGQDLTEYQQANIALRAMIVRCPAPGCPARVTLLGEP
jgi:primosomal protein N''